MAGYYWTEVEVIKKYKVVWPAFWTSAVSERRKIWRIGGRLAQARDRITLSLTGWRWCFVHSVEYDVWQSSHPADMTWYSQVLLHSRTFTKHQTYINTPKHQLTSVAIYRSATVCQIFGCPTLLFWHSLLQKLTLPDGFSVIQHLQSGIHSSEQF